MNKLFRHPWIVIGTILGITVFFALQMPKVILDNDVVNFIPKDSPQVKAYDAQSDLYGSQIQMLMALRQKAGTVFEKEFLLKIKELTEKLGEIELTDSITSLANTDNIRGEGDSILVTPLMDENFTGTPEEIAKIKDGILDWDMYHKSLVSEDFRSTQILISIKANLETTGDKPVDNKVVVYEEIQKILKGMDLKGQEVFLAGTPVLAVLMSKNMIQDLVVLIPLVVLVIILTLFISFRRAGGVILPLATVIISSIWTIGLMALLGVKLTMIATVIPVILVAVGSAYGIHVISHYYDAAMGFPGIPGPEAYRDIVLDTLKKIGLPVLLAGLTTMAGFGSLAWTSLIPVRDFGIFATFGVFAALVIALSFIPALLLIRGPHGVRGGKVPLEGGKDMISLLLLKFFTPFLEKPRLTLGISLVVIGLSIFGTSRIVVDNAVVEFFKGETEISKSDSFLRTDFNGTKSFTLNVKGKNKGDLNDPEALAAMDDLADHLERVFPEVGKVLSYSQFIKRMNQVINADESPEKIRGEITTPVTPVDKEAPAFGFDEPSFGFEQPAFGFDTAPASPAPAAAKAPESKTDSQLSRGQLLELLNQAVLLSPRQNIEAGELLGLINRATNFRGAAYYEIPRDPARYNQADREGLKRLIGNYLVLVGAGTEEWADDSLEPSQAKMVVQMNTTGNLATEKILKEAMVFAQERMPEGISLEAAGMALIEKETTDLIVQSQVWNIISSVALVILILTIFFRSILAGFLSVIPLGISILVSFGVMGFTGIKLDAATSMIAAIAIGTGIDYTIHFLVAYHRGRREHPDHRALMRHTVLTTGKAIMFNALAVAFGFLVLALSQFNPLVYLGVLIALTMLTSSIAALTLMPILLDLLRPKFLDKPLITDTLGGEK